MRAGAPDAKGTLLRNLYETGQFDNFPFKIRLTALLLSRGITTKTSASEVALDQICGLRQISRGPSSQRHLDDSDFERFRWIYSENDFQRYRSVIENLIGRLMDQTPAMKSAGKTAAAPPAISLNAVWTRFETTWLGLTRKQRSAATELHMGCRKRSFKVVATEFGIALYSLKDRWALVKNTFRKAFPEFKHLAPSKTYTKSKKALSSIGAFIGIPALKSARTLVGRNFGQRELRLLF